MTLGETVKQGLALLLLFSLVLPFTPASAQVPESDALTDDLLTVDIEFPNGAELFLSNYGETQSFRIAIVDRSTDAAAGTGQPHRVTVSIEAITNDEGWLYFIAGNSFMMESGDTEEVLLSFTATSSAVESDLRLRINATMETFYCCGTASTEATMLVRSPGSQFAFLRPTSDVNPIVRPDTVVDVDFDVINPGLQDREYVSKVVSNTCGLHTTSASVFVPAGETRSVHLSVLSPSGKLFYLQENCPVQFAMVDQQSGRSSNTATVSVKVQGTYVDPGWVINTIIVLAVIGGVIWLILLAKRRAEEEVLGKPQPPWTLPAEQVYLRELEKKDPQAAYVVRNFLMEDEYRSSLLWYHAYKRATRGRRRMERKVIRAEHAFAKWDLKQQNKLDDVGGDFDREIAKLQAKLDKKTHKAHKKEHKEWSKQVGKIEAKEANAYNKAMNAWRSEAKKARKKGLPEPKEPSRPDMDLPPEPTEEHIRIDDHPWVAKKEKILAKEDKAQEKAEARYEKAHAKRLDAMHRKMAKLADKIDDPGFIKEHPILRDASSS